MNIRLMMTGRSYHQAASLPTELTLPSDARLDDALTIVSEHLQEAGGIPASCLLAIDGKHIGSYAAHVNVALQENCELTLIAPMAGG